MRPFLSNGMTITTPTRISVSIMENEFVLSSASECVCVGAYEFVLHGASLCYRVLVCIGVCLTYNKFIHV